ncbi:StAR-related lipid transfer protein 7, mitochondrial [Frankliniella fusca]|uniref:Phosphatidylcholine transfer protein n=1 Tax=Frankliniella fusca TaxID=407009 RepID=A0AAE1LHK1_9NEOP|nr:StAR-related lipid transfer protein 7, mitochondrial [Frankliniella fusca]
MNCGRLFLVGHRGFVQGLALHGHSRLPFVVRECSVQTRLLRYQARYHENFFARLRKGIQKHTAGISRACARQVEYVMALRIRRTQQAGIFYFQLCGGAFLQQIMIRIFSRFLSRLRVSLLHRSHNLLLSASVLPFFCWEDERIPDEYLLKFSNELEAVACLREHTCQNASVPCKPNGKKSPMLSCPSHFHNDRIEDPWELFIQQGSLLVWRREVPNHRGEGLFEYKVYGAYDDITARDFLAVHVDTVFRREWDSSAVVLDVLEREPQSNSEVVYWEMQWPRMMSNRDYVYKRRYIIDEEQKVIVFVNQNTEHQSAPVKPGKQRVTEYWSIIVIKPLSDLDKPGLEFSMTYFDNPGLVFPSAFASWATATGFPDYLSKLHMATVKFAERRVKEEAEAEARKAAEAAEAAEAAAREEKRRRGEEDKKKLSSPHPDPPKTWEVFFGGGPVLSSVANDFPDPKDRLNYLLNKLMLLGT